MKEFKISDTLMLQRSWNGSAHCWYLKRGRKDNFGLFKVTKVIKLSHIEAGAIHLIIQNEAALKDPGPETAGEEMKAMKANEKEYRELSRRNKSTPKDPDGPNDPRLPEQSEEGAK